MIMYEKIKTKEFVLAMAVLLLWAGLASGQGGGMIGGGGSSGGGGGGMAGGWGGMAGGGAQMGGWGVGPTTPSDNFVTVWDSIGLSATLSQTPEQEGPMEAPVHALGISAVIDVLDRQYVMGLSTNTLKVTKVLDETRRTLPCTSTFQARTERTFHAFKGPEPLAIQLNLDPGEVWPLGLSHVECQIHALYARDHEMFEIPFAASDQWIELKSGISVRVDQALCNGVDYGYLLRVRYDDDDPAKFSAGRYATRLPDDMVMAIQLLDAEGTLIPESNMNSMRIDNVNIRTGKGSSAEVQAIQFKLATEPREEKITLVLTDLPVPSL
jgi:hypothetical protein